MKSVSRGIVYTSFGHAYNRYTKLSIRSLRRKGKYRGPIRLLTNLPQDFAEYGKECEIIHVSQDGASDFFQSRFFKTQLNVYDFEETLFIDSDCLIIKPIASVWSYLDNCDIAMAINKRQIAELSREYFSFLYPPQEVQLMETTGLLNHYQYNSGVILFRKNDRVDKLFKEWHREWLKFGKYDQFALIRALDLTKTVPHILDNDYNYQFIHSRPLKDIVIVHCLGLRSKDEAIYNASDYFLFKFIRRIKKYFLK